MTTARLLWGQRIAEGRQAVGLTQVQLAAAMKVTQQLVSNWERGHSAPRDERRVQLARILGTTPEELFAYPTNGDNGDTEAA